MALALDGSAANNWVTSQTNPTVTLSTANSNDIIVVAVAPNNNTLQALSVTATGLTFVNRAEGTTGGAPGTGTNDTSEWYAVAASPLTNVVITANLSGPTSFGNLVAFGISGANTSTVFDSNGVLPVVVTGAGGVADPVFSTTGANTMVVGIFRMGSVGSPTPGAGWTSIYNGAGAFFCVQYKLFSSAQTSVTCPLTTGTGDETVAIADAYISASAVIPPVPSRGPMPKQIYIMP